MKKLLLTSGLALAAMLLPLGVQAQVYIADDFSTPGDVNQNRTPNIATIDGRNYVKVTNNATYSTAVNINPPGTARMYTNVGGAISLADAAGFAKPDQLQISSTFSTGTLTNNSPARTGRGVYLGFWSDVQFTTDSMTDMYGVFVNADSGRLVLWQGEASSTGAAAATLDYIGTWDDSVFHTMSYKVDISGTITGTAGNIYDFVFDGESYDWGTVSLFTDANTEYAGFGVSAAVVGQYGEFDQWAVTAIPEPASGAMVISLGIALVFLHRTRSQRKL